jgi:RHS repeat-associated protein
MRRVAASIASVTALDHRYAYDVLGRVTAVDDHVHPLEDRSFGYDALGRLVSASGPWGSGQFSYDVLNNLREKTLGSRVVELDYDAPTGRLWRYRDSGSGGSWRYQGYDARGNVTDDGVHGFVYDRSERAVSVSGGASGSFVYDAHGRRVKQVLDGETIYTVYGIEGALYLRENATTGESTDYVRMGDFVVGRVDETDTFERIFADRLGGPVIGATRQSSVLWRESYTPFGELLDDPPANRDEAGFTGHIRDHATGLTYAQARYYNPVIGRFLSHDPVGFADMGGDWRYFNRYAYAFNNPASYTDPNGMCPNCITGGIGAGVGGLIGGGAALVAELTDDTPGVSAGRIAAGAGKGAIVGGVTGFTGNPVLGAGAGAALGAADGGLSAASAGGDAGDIVVGAASQATIDGVGALAGGGIGKVVGRAAGDTFAGQAAGEFHGNFGGAVVASFGQASADAVPPLAGAVTAEIAEAITALQRDPAQPPLPCSDENEIGC